MNTSNFIIAAAVLIITTVFYWTCNKNPVTPENFAGYTQDYLPEITNKLYTVIETSNGTVYDSLDYPVYELSKKDTSKYYFGNDTISNSSNGIPIYTYNKFNIVNLGCMYKYIAGELYGIDHKSNFMVKIMPKDLALNSEWIYHLKGKGAADIHFNVIEKLSNYMNPEGKAYNDVINLKANFENHKFYLRGFQTNDVVYDSTATVYQIYLAKNEGIVGAKQNIYQIQYEMITDSAGNKIKYIYYNKGLSETVYTIK